ncbi:MarR family winged helix-turn-helix transcriptional regulator [Prauserella rugosa]|uniref:DNA-binding MarR family transcriptional regulator n=1 Tax=Prauserella rugosa TaxID=43354 RepID=A0A660CD44_9PSEU|nr:MarR family transcriptional regulator [Prauserella rugosa]KID29285.1 transcriptional regulator [Prauserella sp. Am3]KMS87209.1 MarR family transcriptional regulator [Streptomyces regensis]TWH21498.1 DNA-binding MarR family transcriptional regulator [Prauserella rugosa]
MPDPSQDDLDLADELGTQLVRFFRAMAKTKSYMSKIGPDGIERAAYAILFYLVNNGPQRTSALADAMHSDISTVSRQSTMLVQHGLVERTADPEDGRATLLAPTAEGQRVFEENRKLRAKSIASMLQEWERDDRVAVTHLLGRLNDEFENFQQQNPPTSPDTDPADTAAPANTAEPANTAVERA